MGAVGVIFRAIAGFLLVRNNAIGAKVIVAIVGSAISGFAELALCVSVICSFVTSSGCGVATLACSNNLLPWSIRVMNTLSGESEKFLFRSEFLPYLTVK